MNTTTIPNHHHHEEDWRLRPGLGEEEKALARIVRPMLQTARRGLVALGTAALADTGQRKVRATASALSHNLTGWRRDLPPMPAGSRGEPVRRALSDASAEMQSWAMAICHDGYVSGDAASGLRAAYRRFRHAAGILWYSELVPEAHAPGGRGANRG